MDFVHIPVLLHEVLEGLAIRPDGIYVDGTVGGAGHSTEIAKRLTAGGKLIGFDRDPDAVEVATQRLAPYPATVVHHNYDEMAEVLTEMGEVPVDGVLLDLGVSSHQLDEESRGADLCDHFLCVQGFRTGSRPFRSDRTGQHLHPSDEPDQRRF